MPISCVLQRGCNGVSCVLRLIVRFRRLRSFCGYLGGRFGSSSSKAAHGGFFQQPGVNFCTALDCFRVQHGKQPFLRRHGGRCIFAVADQGQRQAGSSHALQHRFPVSHPHAGHFADFLVFGPVAYGGHLGDLVHVGRLGFFVLRIHGPVHQAGLARIEAFQPAVHKLLADHFGYFHGFRLGQRPEHFHLRLSGQGARSGFRQRSEGAPRGPHDHLFIRKHGTILKSHAACGRRFHWYDLTAGRITAPAIAQQLEHDFIVFRRLFVTGSGRIFKEQGRIAKHVNKTIPAGFRVRLDGDCEQGHNVNRTRHRPDDQFSVTDGVQVRQAVHRRGIVKPGSPLHRTVPEPLVHRFQPYLVAVDYFFQVRKSTERSQAQVFNDLAHVGDPAHDVAHGLLLVVGQSLKGRIIPHRIGVDADAVIQFPQRGQAAVHQRAQRVVPFFQGVKHEHHIRIPPFTPGAVQFNRSFRRQVRQGIVTFPPGKAIVKRRHRIAGGISW